MRSARLSSAGFNTFYGGIFGLSIEKSGMCPALPAADERLCRRCCETEMPMSCAR